MFGVKHFIVCTRGGVMMESVIMMPIMLLALMAAVQFAHIIFARQVTGYAAYCAARSGRSAMSPSVASENALNAAKQVCSIISLVPPANSTGAAYTLPWLGEAPGSQALDSKLSVTCPLGSAPAGAFAAEVTMHFPLVVPVVNSFLSGFLKFRDVITPDPKGMLREGTPHAFAKKFTDDDIFPHIIITRRALLPANPPLTD